MREARSGGTRNAKDKIAGGRAQVTLGHAIKSVRGGFSVKCEDRPADTGETGVLKTGCVLSGRFSPDENKFVPEGERSALRTPVTAGTIIFCRKNSEDAIGRCALVRRSHPNTFLSDLLWELTPAEEICPEWLLAVLQSDHIRALIQRRSTGTQSTMKNISQDRLLSIPIVIPHVAYQQKVAKVLGRWDDAIETLDRLIKAKRTWLKAVSRVFFDPCHPTFAGRPGDWRKFKLGDVFRERDEQGRDDDRLLSITMSGGVIDRDEVGRKDTSNDDKSAYKVILPGDIGYNTMRMWQGVSGLSQLRGIVSPAYTIVTPDNRGIIGRYAAHLFKASRMVFDFERYSQGLTSDTWNLKFPAFSKIVVHLPPIKLQQQQAALMDAMREEIAVFEAKRDVFAKQKRGLMQRLVTGKWQVTHDAEAAA